MQTIYKRGALINTFDYFLKPIILLGATVLFIIVPILTAWQWIEFFAFNKPQHPNLDNSIFSGIFLFISFFTIRPILLFWPDLFLYTKTIGPIEHLVETRYGDALSIKSEKGDSNFQITVNGHKFHFDALRPQKNLTIGKTVEIKHSRYLKRVCSVKAL